MSEVRRGRILLKWCRICNLPIISQNRCSLCNSPAEIVRVTPPGDARPAFPGDIQLIIETANRQWGKGSGEALLYGGLWRVYKDTLRKESCVVDDSCLGDSIRKVVLLSRVPSEEVADEIIVDGVVVGQLVYDPFRAEGGRCKDCSPCLPRNRSGI
ncbi:MAG: hypothetical protein QW728_01200 [Thermoplasmata archaeon]